MRFQRRSKYNAVKVEIDGYIFDSKLEARRFEELKLLRSAGEIESLEVHPEFGIPPKDRHRFDRWGHICKVVLDFGYRSHGRQCQVYEDVKGKDNALSRLKRKLVQAFYGFEVEVVKPYEDRWLNRKRIARNRPAPERKENKENHERRKH